MCTEGRQRISQSASQQISGNRLDLARINKALDGTIFQDKLHHHATVDSTQILALEAAASGAPAGQVYLADEQIEGRGRGGHTWHSAPAAGLYLSVLVRPAMLSRDALQLSLATGIALRWAVHESTAVDADIRWPNDLVIPQADGRSRKAGGILTEATAASDGSVRHAVIGIGVNLNMDHFPAELATLATSLRIESGQPVSREAILIALLSRLDRELRILQGEQHPGWDNRPLHTRFCEASSWVTGKHVQVAEDDGYTGVTDGLNEAGLLRVRCTDASVRTVRHGGVREAD